MYLKYCRKKDLDYLKSKYENEIKNLILRNDDSIYKNFIIYDFVLNSKGGRDKILDCGSGPSPLAWLLCDYFKEGHMIDISVKNKFSKQNLNHNIGDFFSYIETHEDNSIDYALDGCSLIHFEYDETGNTGLIKSANSLYRKIKKNGYLVIASDVISHLEESDHGQKEFLKVKDMIEIYESEGFNLIGEFDYESINNDFVIDLNYHGKSRFDLTYCNLIFKKN
jgi:hypothetical protein